MNEREYIKIIRMLYDGANEYTIKVWTKEPSYSNIHRTIRLVKSYGYDEIYYTCIFNNKDYIRNIENSHNIKIYDMSDVINKCIELNRMDLIKNIDKKNK